VHFIFVGKNPVYLDLFISRPSLHGLDSRFRGNDREVIAIIERELELKAWKIYLQL